MVKIKEALSLWRFQILKIGLYGLIIIICLGSFTYNGLIRGLIDTPNDFRSTDFEFFYASGTLWHEGRDIYNKSLLMPLLDQLITEQKARQNNAFYVNFYPPQSNALFSLLSLWNPETARLIMLLFNCLLLSAGMAMLTYILSWYRPLGLAEAALLSSFLAIGFARQNLRESQLGLIVFTLLLGTFLLTHYARPGLAGAVLGVLSIKPTFLPLFVAYYLLKGSWRLVGTCIITGVLLTLVPLVLTSRSIVQNLFGLWNNLQQLFLPGGPNDQSPFMTTSATMLHLQPLVYRLLDSPSLLATGLTWLLLLGLVGYSAYLIWRSRELDRHYTELLDFGLVSILSLVFTYHRVYDNFLLLPGFLYLYLYARANPKPTYGRSWLILLGIVILLYCLPANLADQLSNKFTFLKQQDSYLGRVVAPFQTWTTLGVLASLLWLKTRQVQTPPSRLQEQFRLTGRPGYPGSGSSGKTKTATGEPDSVPV